MKLLINLCSHDGVVSHYTGVGTMTKRYIEVLVDILKSSNIDYRINLFTPEYNKNSFGFSAETKEYNVNLEKVEIIEVSNGTNGVVNYGKPEDWEELCKNASKIINSINFSNYDSVLTLYNDTPFAGLGKLLAQNDVHQKVWIPHSTVKIHEVDSAIKDYKGVYKKRLKWEEDAINYINNNELIYVGVIGNFIENHLIKEYGLKKKKAIRITNGEILDKDKSLKLSKENKLLFEQLKNSEAILLSFGRAEEYKNLEATMYLGYKLNIDTVVIAQSYYKEQEILKRYKKTAYKTNSLLYIDTPFDFPKYILNNFDKPLIMLVPSKKEVMGLIINETRKLSRENILVVANDIDGLKEQVEDELDGVLVNLSDLESSARKILKNFEKSKMQQICYKSLKTLELKYDLKSNVNDFLNELLEV